MKIENINKSLHTGEHNARSLRITIDEEYLDYTIKLAFHTPGGETYISEEVETIDGVGEFELTSSLLDATGSLKAQVFVYNGDNFIAKSDVFAFRVMASVDEDATTTPQNTSFTNVSTLGERMTEVEELVAGLSEVAETGSFDDLVDVPTSFPPSMHMHPVSEISDFNPITKMDKTNPVGNGSAHFSGDVYTGSVIAPDGTVTSQGSILATQQYASALFNINDISISEMHDMLVAAGIEEAT